MKLPVWRRACGPVWLAALCALTSAPAPASAAVTVVPAPAASPRRPPVRAQVIGGVETRRNAYPWMTAIYLGGAFHCGAALVAPDWVVTAAHCASPHDRARLTLLIGQSDRTHGSGGEWRKVKAVQRHPKYVYHRDGASPYDVALIELDRPSAKPPVAVPPTTRRALWKPNSTVRALGWGTTSPRSSARVTRLRQTDLPVVADSLMKRAYGSRFSAATMLGAGPWKGGRDTCAGDSGGPLVAATRSTWWLVGITSWGDGCARAGKPGVYSRVPEPPIGSFVRSVL